MADITPSTHEASAGLDRQFIAITAVEIAPATFTRPANADIERFVPHSPVLARTPQPSRT